MILLDANIKAADLPFVTTHAPEEMLFRLGEAVSAYAALKDPMADPFHGGEDMLLLEIANTVEALTANTTFDDEKIQGDELAWLVFSGVLEESSYRVWMFIIRYLGEQLIARNYAQGWQDRHQIFCLEFPYLGDLGDDLYTLSPEPLHIVQHWVKFTQAVTAQHMIREMAMLDDPISSEEGSRRQDAVERLAGFVELTIDFLAANYPIMGCPNGEKWKVISDNPNQANQAWRINILNAAEKLSKELANRA